MNLIEQIKNIENYVCENFEELDIDDPVEEGYFEEYETISGTSKEEFARFEKKYCITLPDEFKELYSYKNGSKFFGVLPVVKDKLEMSFCLMSLEQIDNSKNYFHNKDSLLTDFPDFFTSEDIENMKDNRIKPYLFNKKWFPFAQYCDSCYLILDFDPGKDGQIGQIICYIHDPDKVIYVSQSISDLVSKISEELK